MRRFSRPIIVTLLCVVAGVLAVSIWIIRNRRSDSPRSPQATANSLPAKCEQWEGAKVSGQGTGWDLVYESTLKGNGFGPDSPMWKWIHQYADGRRPPVNEIFSKWEGEPITSSILIEVVGPEGSPGGFWFIRTTNHLYRWDFNKGEFDREKEELKFLKEYDQAFATIACWQQDAPVKSDTLFEGYYGFLSLYQEGKSRQMLLTFRDFFAVDPRNEEVNLKDQKYWGRLWKTLGPVLSSAYQPS